MNKDPKTVALLFNECINSRDLTSLTALMTEDHRFIDSATNQVEGKSACSKAWEGFFNLFPDYRNQFDSLSSDGNLVSIKGYSQCSDMRLNGKARWTAIIKDVLVLEWRVYEDKDEAKTYGLTHLAIAVHNLRRTLQFYQKVFDMELMYHEKDFIQLKTPGAHDILVFEEKVNQPVGNAGGIAHFGFRLKDPGQIQDIITKIKSAGGNIIDQGEFVPGSPYVFFNDPDGYEVEVWYESI